MRNNIKSLLAYSNHSVEYVAKKIGVDSKLLNYYVQNPTEDLPYNMVKCLADFFEVPERFIRGIHCKYRIEPQDLEDSLREDLTTSGEARDYLKFIYCGGYYDDLNTNDCIKGIGFIAMSFGFDDTPELSTIKNAFESAISNAGYLPKIMCDVQTNNYITTEIFALIDRCQFLVLDTTFDNLGAYFEAGYAKGRGKPVIICCQKSKFDNCSDHFDIRQINHVLWEDYDDLIAKLTVRIEETVG